MSSNSISLGDREICSGSIEGVYFGPKVWVIARSPAAMLIWVYGHSYSVNGFQKYAEPHLTLLPDRSPRFMNQPTYKNFPVPGNRLKAERITTDAILQIGATLNLGPGDGAPLIEAIDSKRTLLIEGGGGSLAPVAGLFGQAYHDWKTAGGGFIVLPEGMSEHEACRGKLGWKPKEKTT